MVRTETWEKIDDSAAPANRLCWFGTPMLQNARKHPPLFEFCYGIHVKLGCFGGQRNAAAKAEASVVAGGITCRQFAVQPSQVTTVTLSACDRGYRSFVAVFLSS